MKPMLAMPHSSVAPTVDQALMQLEADGWYFEPKWDGVRVLAHVDGGEARLVNRNGTEITNRYPDVVADLEKLWPWGYWVLDGELVVLDAKGHPDFNGIARRNQATTEASIARAVRRDRARLFAFDVLHDGNENVDIRGLPYTARRGTLNQLTLDNGGQTHLGIMLTPSGTSGQLLMERIRDMGLEGIMAKRPDAPYVGKRSPGWVKLRCTRTISALVTGVEEGKGSRTGKIGALLLGVIDPAALANGDIVMVPVGKVGTGFTEAMLRDVAARYATGDPLVVDVEYANLTEDGKLRFPSFRGIRDDVHPLDCTTTQLED